MSSHNSQVARQFIANRIDEIVNKMKTEKKVAAKKNSRRAKVRPMPEQHNKFITPMEGAESYPRYIMYEEGMAGPDE